MKGPTKLALQFIVTRFAPSLWRHSGWQSLEMNIILLQQMWLGCISPSVWDLKFFSDYSDCWSLCCHWVMAKIHYAKQLCVTTSQWENSNGKTAVTLTLILKVAIRTCLAHCSIHQIAFFFPFFVSHSVKTFLCLFFMCFNIVCRELHSLFLHEQDSTSASKPAGDVLHRPTEAPTLNLGSLNTKQSLQSNVTLTIQ